MSLAGRVQHDQLIGVVHISTFSLGWKIQHYIGGVRLSSMAFKVFVKGSSYNKPRRLRLGHAHTHA